MPDEYVITCSTHGEQPAAFVCQHIARSLYTGLSVGFNSADDPENPRPDSWCDECEQVFIAEGSEWNDKSVEFAGISVVCAGCYDRAKQINTNTFVCPQCGKQHGELPLDLAYHRPADYFKISEAERSTRIKIDSDLCVIDETEFYIRGVLELPVQNTEKTFTWGVWARVKEGDFRKYLELWDVDNVESEPRFEAKLSGGAKYYAGSDFLDITVHLRSNGKRPLFKVVADDHPLGIDQRNGITMEKVHHFLEDYLL
jgi:hypothetical protein